MTSISSAGSFTIPAAQPARRQAERSASATETELTVKQEQQVRQADDNQGRGSSEQAKRVENNQASSSVTQADDEKSAEQRQTEQRLADGELQKNEAARQEAQRAEFDQHAGKVREAEPNDVRPLSTSDSATEEKTIEEQGTEEKIVETRAEEATKVETLQADSPAIETFNQLQNINASPRQGQEINKFA
jgi:hypothetical protein